MAGGPGWVCRWAGAWAVRWSATRVKRTLSEAFWSLEGDLPDDHDFVVVARAGASDVVGRDGLEGVRRELAELLGRLGWTAGGAAAEAGERQE